MKRITRILSIIPAAVLMLTIILSSFATAAEIMPLAVEQTGSGYKGSIKLTSPDLANSIEGRTFRVYRIFDATLGSGDYSGTVAYRIYDDSVRTALVSMFFDGDEIKDHLDTELINEVLKLKDNVDKTSKLQELAGKLYDEVEKSTSKVEYVQKTATDDELLIDNLKLGYYLVVDRTAGSDKVIAAFALDTTDPDVEIEMKMGRPTIEKWFDNDKTNLNSADSWDDDTRYANSASIGDIINYKIVSTVPDTTGYTEYTYTITDTLSAGLTLITQNDDGEAVKPVVTLVKSDDTPVRVLVEGDDYTYGFRNNKLTFTIDGIMSYPKDYKIVITYSARLNENAVVGGGGNTNTASLLYSNNPRVDSSSANTPPETLTTYTFELDITKTALNADDYFLPGAEFKLYRITGNSPEKRQYAEFDESGKLTGWTEELADGNGWSSDSNTVTTAGSTIITDKNGKALIKGIEEGVYYLEETKAPAGYTKLTKPVKIEFIATYDDETNPKKLVSLTAKINDKEPAINALAENIADGINANAIIPLTVENAGGPPLPETGGMGTTLIYVIGAILAVGAGVLLVAKKRMGSTKA